MVDRGKIRVDHADLHADGFVNPLERDVYKLVLFAIPKKLECSIVIQGL